jgi:hypothetical protein
MRAICVVILAMTLAACAPDDIATATCTNTVLSLHDEWTCKVHGDVVGRPSSVEFDTESRNRVAEVTFTLQVARGSVRVRYADTTGSQQIVVTPSEPANVRMKTTMHPQRRSFTLSFEPVDGIAEGLTGTVKYSTPPS